MSTIGGHLFDLPVLEIERGMYVEDEAGHRQGDTIDGNNYCTFNVSLSFSFHLHAKPLLVIHVIQTFHFRLGSSSTSRASPIGRVLRHTLRICRVPLLFPAQKELGE